MCSGAVLWCAQSILTGESGSVAKFVGAVTTRKAVYQDKTCLLFSVRHGAPTCALVGWAEPLCLGGTWGASYMQSC